MPTRSVLGRMGAKMNAVLLLTLHTPSDTVDTATVFPNVSLANNFIDKLAHDKSTDIASLKMLEQNHYSLQTSYGLTGDLSIDETPNSQLRFYLLKSVNGTYRETRAFTSRQGAVNYVTKFLDEYDFDPDDDENKSGDWTMESGNINIRFRLKISYTNSDSKLDKYYRILKINSPSTREQIQHAYRKRSKETHPDMGGDAAEFRKVNEAYKILINKSDTGASNHKMSVSEISALPDSASIEHVLHTMKQEARESYNSSLDNTDGSALGLILTGLIIAGIGIVATSVSYNSAEEGGRYTIFSGLIAVGGYYVIRGIANLFKR